MSALPYLPNELINKINNMAYEMEKMEKMDKIQFNQEILKNNINKLIEYTKEDYEEEYDPERYDNYADYIFINYSFNY
tara:strand:+ start:2061 stop:2294 length:234 start_codon:yes stop_codon:yes gene_type:complete